MSEETDALNNRIRQLENQVADMQRLVQDTSDLLDIARANGLDKFLTGHGFYETQGGINRFDQNGMQIKTAGGLLSAIYFVGTEFEASPTTSTAAYLAGQYLGTNTGLVYLGASQICYVKVDRGSDVITFGVTNGAIGVTGPAVVGGSVSGLTGALPVRLNLDASEGAVLKLGTTTADPGGVVDADIWFRSDTFKFRARANGVTENLATESYVAANAPTGFADHFLVMGG